ncbi:hypothetical protein GCM10027062_15480 [Nocardioides hungaricus]
MAPAVSERFHATNGQVSGYVGLALTLGILALAVLPWETGRPLGVAILAVLGTLLVWCAMLRPALWATERTLVMRGMFHTEEIPLGSIDRVAVSQVTAVSAGGRRYLSPVVGYTARQKIRTRRRSARGDAIDPTAQDTYQLYVEERITQLAQEDRERFGPTDAGVRRTWAWPEIVGCVVLVIAFLVWLLAL